MDTHNHCKLCMVHKGIAGWCIAVWCTVVESYAEWLIVLYIMTLYDELLSVELLCDHICHVCEQFEKAHVMFVNSLKRPMTRSSFTR